MTYPDIRSVVPHEGQMVLLDELVTAEGDDLCAELTITPATVFADADGVGSWIGVEYMAQAIAAHAGYAAHLRGEPAKVGFLLGARRYDCAVPRFAMGSVLLVHVHRALQGDNGLGAFDCRIVERASAAVLATATITVFQPDNVRDFLQGSSQ